MAHNPRLIRLAVCLLVSLFLPAAGKGEGSDRARQIVKKAVEAMGGEANLKKFQAATWKGKGVFHGPGGDISFSGTWSVQYPDQARIMVETPFEGQTIRRTLVVNGDKGWIKMNEDTEEMDQEILTEEKERLYASWLASAVPLLDQDSVLSAAGKKRIAGEETVGIKVNREGQREVTLYFSSRSGMLIKTETMVKDRKGGRDVKQGVVYQKYQVVQGVQKATRITVTRDDKVHAKAEFVAFKVEEKLPAEVFSKP